MSPSTGLTVAAARSDRRIRAAAVSLVLAVFGCGGDPNSANAGCSDPVTISVGSGLEPIFSWAPKCAVYNLVVLEGVGPHPFEQQAATWGVESLPDASGLPNNRLHSSVRYGDIPSDGRQVTAPATLVAGQAYTVYLNVFTWTSESKTWV